MTADIQPHLAGPPSDAPASDAPVSVDLPAATRAGRQFLAALGIATGTPDGRDAGRQLARAYAMVLGTEPPPPTVEQSPSQDLAVVPATAVWSLCPQHLLPIPARANVGYLPRGYVVSAPALARALRYLAAPPQQVSHIAARLAHWLQEAVRPAGSAVTVRLDHTCPPGNDPPGTDAAVAGTALRGRLREIAASEPKFAPLPARPPPTQGSGAEGGHGEHRVDRPDRGRCVDLAG